MLPDGRAGSLRDRIELREPVRFRCVNYPFEPRSTAYLEPGQFWAVPLSDGRFACGRVLDLPRTDDPHIPVSKRTFLAGLLEWVSDSEPTEKAIGGAPLLRQGFAHIKAIRETGGMILGLRPLAADDIQPHLWVTTGFLPQAWVYRGADPVRRAADADRSLPVMGVWGYNVIRVIAEHAFVRAE
jgi:hypothetical protein